MNPDGDKKSPLWGRWSLVCDMSGNEMSGAVTVEFTRNGTITYSIDTGKTIQVINLVYRIEGDELVTDQPSSPQEHRTKFFIDENGLLTLENAGQRTFYKRI